MTQILLVKAWRMWMEMADGTHGVVDMTMVVVRVHLSPTEVVNDSMSPTDFSMLETCQLGLYLVEQNKSIPLVLLFQLVVKVNERLGILSKLLHLPPCQQGFHTDAKKEVMEMKR
jgi:hypothetical protein